jgi:hypothetical protein
VDRLSALSLKKRFSRNEVSIGLQPVSVVCGDWRQENLFKPSVSFESQYPGCEIWQCPVPRKSIRDFVAPVDGHVQMLDHARSSHSIQNMQPCEIILDRRMNLQKA